MITANGLVLREKSVGEADKFIDILTPEYGIIEVSVKGAKKINGKNASSAQLFAYSRFCCQKRGEYYYLNSSEPVQIFYGIRTDIVKTALASYFSELLLYTVTSGQTANDIMRLALNTFHYLSTGERSPALLKSIFELRLLSELGMMPDLLGCHKCLSYKEPEMNFLPSDGILLCSDCSAGYSNHKIPISDSVLHTLRTIVLSELDKLWSFRLSEHAEKTLSAVSEEYLLAQLDRGFKTLEFYKSL